MSSEELFARNLKYLRSFNKLSQTKAAKYLGVNRRTFVSWETGGITPPTSTLTHICKSFKVSIQNMLTIDYTTLKPLQ